MGTWITSIDADDAYLDLDDCFFQHSNDGEAVERCATLVMDECSAHFSDQDVVAVDVRELAFGSGIPVGIDRMISIERHRKQRSSQPRIYEAV